MKIRLLFVIMFLFAISCDDAQEEKIVGFWKLETVKTNQNISNPEQYQTAMDQLIRTTSIQFNTDKSFGGTVWGDTSFGYWLIKNDSLIIQDLSNKNDFSVLITELTNHKLTLQETVDSVVEVFTFVK
ncbi:MAG: hypothetical protein JXL97_14340 [Bacteroidales bacterium]|nr:hypothetical protein [Bacteroidales bacterium]